MEREFASYEQAVALKELGFDEECLATYVGEVLDLTLQTLNDDYFTVAPLKQQVFRWFREKYGLEGVVQKSHDYEWYNYHCYLYGKDVKRYLRDWWEIKTYEEAENACIDKLIELAKQQSNGN